MITKLYLRRKMFKTKKKCDIPNCREVLLYNVLEERYQSLLKPFSNIMLPLFFCSKYVIRDNFITPNGASANIKAFIGNVLFGAAFAYSFEISLHSLQTELKLAVVLNSSFDLVFSFSGLFLIYAWNILHSNINVRLVLEIQEIDTKLKSDKKNIMNFVNMNWIYCLLISLYYIVLCTYLRIFDDLSVLQVFCTLLLIAFDLNLMYAQRMVQLLGAMLSLWMRRVQKSSNLKKQVNKLRLPRHDAMFDGAQFFDIYSKLLDAFRTCSKLFPGMVFYYVSLTFAYFLLYVHFLIEFSKLPRHDSKFFRQLMEAVSMLSWLFKNIIILSAMCRECEQFYSTVREAESLCSCIAAGSGASAVEKRLAKNMIRLHRTQFEPMSVLGVEVNACLPILLVYHITAYTAVLLQFLLIK